MDNRTNLTLKSKDQSDTTVTTNLQYVNGSLSNATLAELAQQFNSLTTNTLQRVTKITQEVIY